MHTTGTTTTTAAPDGAADTGTGEESSSGTNHGTGRDEIRPGAAAWELAAEARAASRARDLTTRTLRAWNVTGTGDVDDIVLIVDELVTNAVVHGTGPVRLALRLDDAPGGASVAGEIGDGHPAAPGVPDGPPRVLDWSEAGRGLLLVAALATDFGARPAPSGKTVWFTRRLT
ncbi:ATP-binding protein, partial [Actinomadura darangshiensis]